MHDFRQSFLVASGHKTQSQLISSRHCRLRQLPDIRYAAIIRQHDAASRFRFLLSTAFIAADITLMG